MKYGKAPYVSRRGFMTASAIAAAASLPKWFVEESLAAEAAAPVAPKGPNEMIKVGWIGTGGRGADDARGLSRVPNVQISAICDVDASHLTGPHNTYPSAESFSDFRKLLERKDLDAVLVSTPDHWHTLI